MQTLDDFEPLEYYKKTLKDAFRGNAEKYFDALVVLSGVDAARNKETVARYEAAAAKADAAEKKLASGKVLRGFVVFFLIAALIAGAVLLFLGVPEGDGLFIALGTVCLALAVLFFVLLLTGIKKMVAARQKKYDAAAEKARSVRDEAMSQMHPLHVLFRPGMGKELIEQTVPDLRLDDYFDVRKYDLMSRKYGLSENADPDRSTVCVLSGTVDYSPFLYVREFCTRLEQRTYTGSLVIHWVTYSYDSKGNRQTHHHSQTLTARYTAPAPVYGYETRLYYGNEAAPDLSFSRAPTHAERLSEAEVERMVKKGVKRIREKMEDAVTEGRGGFTEMGDSEFDVLFGALDRDNEVQFRVLFTPLAQKNMLALIRSDEAYGDDFSFIKQKMLNCIRSEHAQTWQMEPDLSRFMNYDLEACRTEFVTFYCEYFRALYFDLAPLLAIPAYQLHKPREFIYRDVYASNCTSFETEAMANRFPAALFAHPETRTETILKTGFVQKDGKSDKVGVTAYSYNAVPRVAYIPMFGGDGLMHEVPVPWTEYLPLTRTSEMEVRPVGGTQEDYERSREGGLSDFVRRFADDVRFHRGIFAFPVAQGHFTSEDDARLGAFFKEAPAPASEEVAEKLKELDEALGIHDAPDNKTI